MNELDTQQVWAVDRGNEAAWSAVMKIAASRPRPGQVISLTSEEFAALKSGVLALHIPGVTT